MSRNPCQRGEGARITQNTLILIRDIPYEGNPALNAAGDSADLKDMTQYVYSSTLRLAPLGRSPSSSALIHMYSYLVKELKRSYEAKTPFL